MSVKLERVCKQLSCSKRGTNLNLPAGEETLRKTSTLLRSQSGSSIKQV
jgi:hypothetical protein